MEVAMTGARTAPHVAAPPEPRCLTTERLAALKPGEEFRYLSYVETAQAGPLCKALYERIHDFARGLALKGRVELRKEEHPIGRGDKQTVMSDFIARGVERKRPG
jgi:hypothetical protein